MTTRINYIGTSDLRVVRRTDILAADLSDPGQDLIWRQENGYELDVADDIALFLVSQGDFLTDEAMSFGEVLEEFLVNGVAVNHGADANVERPNTTSPVIWEGTVEPLNMIDGDLWLDTDESAALVIPPQLIVPPASNFSTIADTAWFTQYAAYYARFQLSVKTIMRHVLCRIASSSGNIQVGVVGLSGASDLDFTRLGHSGIIAAGATGARRIDIGATVLDPALYREFAVFFWADNTAITVPCAASSAGLTIRACTQVTHDAAGVPANGNLAAWTANRLFAGLALEGDI